MKQQDASQTVFWKINLLLFLTITVALFSAILVARDLGLSRADPSNRMRFHAIPVAISQIYHHRVHDYTAYWSVAMQFQSETPLTAAIQRAISLPVLPEERTYYWVADDRGLSDFVNIGFRLLGPSMPALFYFWFLLFGSSILVAIFRFRNDATALTLIACTVISVGATLPTLTRAASSAFAETSIHLTESRMFDVLAIAAAMHLILTMFRPPTASRSLDFATTLIQAALIAACVHARASVSWLFIGILLLGLSLLLAQSTKSLENFRTSPALHVVVLVIVAWTSVHLYQSVMFNPSYKTGIGPRTFWHNILMGMTASPVFSHALNLDLADKAAIDAVIEDMRERRDPRLTTQWETQNILNSLGSHTSFDWRTYESVARDLVIRTTLAHPMATFLLLTWDKPKEIAGTLLCRFLAIDKKCDWTRAGGVPTEARPIKHQRGLWLSLFVLAGLSLFCVRCEEWGAIRHGDRADVRGLVPALAFMALVGLAPSVLIYPGVTQLGGSFVFALTAITFWLIVSVLRLFSQRPVETFAAPSR